LPISEAALTYTGESSSSEDIPSLGGEYSQALERPKNPKKSPPQENVWSPLSLACHKADVTMTVVPEGELWGGKRGSQNGKFA